MFFSAYFELTHDKLLFSTLFLPEKTLIGGFLSTVVLKLDVLIFVSFEKKLLYFEESFDVSSVNYLEEGSSSSP